MDPEEGERMNIPEKAINLAYWATDDTTHDLTYEEIEEMLVAAFPVLAAKVLRDAANDLRGNLKRLEIERTGDAWLVRANDMGVLLARAEVLDPQ